MLFDLPRDQLESYKPVLKEPEDFVQFWKSGITDGRILSAQPVDTGLRKIEVLDVSFAGWAGTEVKAWLIRPAGETGKLPCVIEYLGYGGGRGNPWDWHLWSQAGYAHFVMDTRGQGSAWLHGDTPDDGGTDYGPAFPGVMTRGIQKPESYYYRRLMVDAVAAIGAAARLPGVDADRIALTGMSQGGGLTIAAAALAGMRDVQAPGRVVAVAPDVPFLCHFRRAVEITDERPYSEIRQYLHVHFDMEETVFRTLSYFDGVHFALRATVPALFSTALMDTICPPSTVFAAYNAWAGEKDIRVYNWNGHEGGATKHVAEKIGFFAQHLSGC